MIGELQDLERKNPGSGAALHACAKRIKAGTLRPADVLSLKGTELLEMRVEVGNRQFRLLYVLEQTADADVALILCLYPFTKSERTPPTAVRTAESRLTEYRSRRPGVA